MPKFEVNPAYTPVADQPKARDGLVAPNTRSEPINQIAYMCGFKSAAHFSRMFRSAYGCSPRDYRDAHSRTEAQGPQEAQEAREARSELLLSTAGSA